MLELFSFGIVIDKVQCIKIELPHEKKKGSVNKEKLKLDGSRLLSFFWLLKLICLPYIQVYLLTQQIPQERYETKMQKVNGM